MTMSQEERVRLFWSKVHKTPTCWIWIAGIQNGYGRFYVGPNNIPAHKFAYELLVGPVPEGLQLDHVKARGCLTRACVNPTHLEPVTRHENLLRGDGFPGQNARKDYCPNGHPLIDGNLCTWELTVGKRACKICANEKGKRWRDENKAKLALKRKERRAEMVKQRLANN